MEAMKRIILSAIVLAFAVAVQAGDTKTTQNTPKDQPSCCSTKVKTSLQANEGPADMDKGGCAGCKMMSAKRVAAKQPKLMSPKELSLASK
jgi:hypothetical protein